MRLFLSSYRFGQASDAFLELVGENPSVGVITNAKDYKSLGERAQSLGELVASFHDIGIEPTEVDLRHFFGRQDVLRNELEKYDVIWLAGGNTFVLRRALKQSGGDELLRELVGANKLVYGGESAGACVAAPTLLGVEFGDDPEIVPEGYADEDVWDGLSLVPYSIVPHYESDWEGYERMTEVLEEAGLPYKTLNDFQALIINGAQETLQP